MKKLLSIILLSILSLPVAAQTRINLNQIQQQATNTVIGNFAAGTGNLTALNIGSCTAAGSALKWTTNTGFGCNTAIDGSTLLGGTWAIPGTIGSTTPNTGAFTSLSAGGFATPVTITPLGATNNILIGREANGGATTYGVISFNNSTTTTQYIGIEAGGGVDPNMYLNTPATGAVIIRPNGHVLGATFDNLGMSLVGTLTATAIASNVGAQTGYLCYNTTAPGTITYDGTNTCLVSLEEYKNIKGPINNALAIIDKLKPFWFSYKNNTPMTDHDIHPGFGAHQVSKVDKRLAAYTTDGKLKGVRYQEMTAVLTAAIQEQQQKIREQDRKIESLTQRLVAIESNQHYVQSKSLHLVNAK